VVEKVTAQSLTTQSATTQGCRKCGADLPARPRRGRPAAYCSEPCRRLAEYEIRRIDRRLELLVNVVSECHLGWNDHTLAEVAMYEAEAARLEGRLRDLLGP
jgi:hypothetical protein